jgi:hypothetical protein
MMFQRNTEAQNTDENCVIMEGPLRAEGKVEVPEII